VAANLPLKAAIIRSGRSQVSLAARTGIPESRISRIVNRWTKATPTERRRIARAQERLDRNDDAGGVSAGGSAEGASLSNRVDARSMPRRAS